MRKAIYVFVVLTLGYYAWQWATLASSNVSQDAIEQVQAKSAPPAAPPSPDPQRKQQCIELLQKVPGGVIDTYQDQGDGFGRVVVGPFYNSVGFDDKALVDANIRCILAKGAADSAGLQYVEYLDPLTHKEIAKWSDVTGFSVD